MSMWTEVGGQCDVHVCPNEGGKNGQNFVHVVIERPHGAYIVRVCKVFSTAFHRHNYKILIKNEADKKVEIVTCYQKWCQHKQIREYLKDTH